MTVKREITEAKAGRIFIMFKRISRISVLVHTDK
jgi:hypothetical protein